VPTLPDVLGLTLLLVWTRVHSTNTRLRAADAVANIRNVGRLQCLPSGAPLIYASVAAAVAAAAAFRASESSSSRLSQKSSPAM